MIKTAFQVMHMCPEKGFCCLLGRHCFASRSVLELYRVQPCLVHPVDAWAPLKKKKKQTPGHRARRFCLEGADGLPEPKIKMQHVGRATANNGFLKFYW